MSGPSVTPWSSDGESTEALVAIPGWYGKVPSLGDFVSRRLSRDFVNTWDEWLQGVLHAAPDILGKGWLDNYLTTPIWRFVLLPGLAGRNGWAGILMPSVDRVGRYFPLTVAVELPSSAALAHAAFTGADWFAGLEEAALAMLGNAMGPEDLDAALSELRFTLPQADTVAASVGALHALRSTDAFESAAKARAIEAWSQQQGWRALWWTRGRVNGDPLMLMSAQLPTAVEFAKLLESGESSPSAILGS
jgi:type VI secretion system protein ImpM